MGANYVFSSNIDNTGAMISKSIAGYFVEQVQQEKIQAMMEAAEKYEGDKGGVPALLDDKFSVLEGAFVPDEWKDRFNGMSVFPYFNTNTFWWTKDALTQTDFDLPLMVTKVIEDKWLKIESIMGHGLEFLKWKALVVDRGMRFLPSKYVTDLWVGRTDWIRWYNGKLLPIMHDGQYVTKPLLQISGKILGTVGDLDSRIFGMGAYDSMKNLQTLMMGGEGKHFGKVGDINTMCAVEYKGDVAIMYEYREGRANGKLIIKGASESDEVTLEDSLIFIPAGEVVVIDKSKNHVHDENIKEQDYRAFLDNAGTWTTKQKERLINKFFPH